MLIEFDGISIVYRRSGLDKAAEEGRCRMCLRPWSIRRPTRHHIVPQWWWNEQRSRCIQHGPFYNPGRYALLGRARDCDANIVPLCEPCHRMVELDASARRTLRKLLGSSEVGFAIKVRGQRWFDDTYTPNHRHIPRKARAA